MKISKEVLSKFCEFNYKFFNTTENKSKGYVFFENNREGTACLFMTKHIAAKAVSEKTGFPVMAVKNRYDSELEQIYKSYGFIPCFIERRVSVYSYIKAIFKTIHFILFHNSGNELLHLKLKGVNVGDLIYDTMIREFDKLYTINKISGLQQYKALYKAIVLTYAYDKLFRTYKPMYFVAGDLVYIQGIMVRFAVKYGAKVLLSTTGYKTLLVDDNQEDRQLGFFPNFHQLLYRKEERMLKTTDKDYQIHTAEFLLEKLFNGIGDWNTEIAYSNDKRVVSRNELVNDTGCNNTKKNVFIMAHCFSDTPNGAGISIYKDYYEWLIETLKLTKKNNKVNWILKAHPCRHIYGESGVVEKLFEEYKHPNLYWIPDDYSSASIPQIADVIITVNGTAGMEYSCFGTPCINVGNPHYARFGYTYNVRSISEYADLIANIEKIDKLDREKTNKAKRVFWAFKNSWNASSDQLIDLTVKYYHMFSNERDDLKNNDEFVNEYLKLVCKEDVRQSLYYISAAEGVEWS